MYIQIYRYIYTCDSSTISVSIFAHSNDVHTSGPVSGHLRSSFPYTCSKIWHSSLRQRGLPRHTSSGSIASWNKLNTRRRCCNNYMFFCPFSRAAKINPKG